MTKLQRKLQNLKGSFLNLGGQALIWRAQSAPSGRDLPKPGGGAIAHPAHTPPTPLNECR